jgi:regulator of sirC expression with transglutaminase-like and TPR domain
MSAAAPPFQDGAGARRFLTSLAAAVEPLPIAEAALALAALDRPGVDLERYRRHLDALTGDVAAAGAADPPEALVAAIHRTHGYAGDRLTYDDLQNANLMRVIDRRKGLPVALGILYVHAGRARGWRLAGMAFPGHFLLRLEAAGAQWILDPFAGAVVADAAELRRLLQAVGGGERALAPEHYAEVGDREVLLRLQNNLKTRMIDAGRAEDALEIVERMLLLAPARAELLRDRGRIEAALGNLGAAIRSLEAALACESDSRLRVATAKLLQDLKRRLQ